MTDVKPKQARKVQKPAKKGTLTEAEVKKAVKAVSDPVNRELAANLSELHLQVANQGQELAYASRLISLQTSELNLLTADRDNYKKLANRSWWEITKDRLIYSVKSWVVNYF